MRGPRTCGRQSGRRAGAWLLLVVTACTWASTPMWGAAQVAVAMLLPNGVAYDAAGDLYFADTNRNQVFESTLAGKLIVVAGSGAQGYGGDGGAATSAMLNEPQGVAIGPDGTVYVADTGNQRIRAVVAGQITTFAGNGSAGFAGDGGAATTAEFNRPTALAVDATGALLVCDSGNERVRRISAGAIATFAGDGVQGFAGDGGAAVAAELDAPAGVAVGPMGQVYVADSHNERIRVVAVDGTISTLAGNGRQGYSGDGGAAAAAELALPRGVMVTATGAVVFADSNNQRIRMVSAGGTISTIAGNGVQGMSSDGSAAGAAALNTPRGVAVSSFGAPVFTDAPNRAVREVAANNDLYVVAGMAGTARTSTVSVALPPSAVYGASAEISVAGSAGTPQGVVQLLENGTVVAQGALSAGGATLPLPAGSYAISASYMGDGVNPAATSAAANVSLGPAVVTASAESESIEYGQAVPTLNGSLTGVLAQDRGNVTAVFRATAAAMSPVGTYPISATLTGPASGNYSVVMAGGSGTLKIAPATAEVEERPLAQSSYAGLPLLLSAEVVSTTQGVPTGTVSFVDGGTTVATAKLSGGVASATYLAPAGGGHSIVAEYSGDGDFSAGSSVAVTTVVGAMPDYTVGFAGNSSQTVAASLIATYQVRVAAAPGPFTGAVSMGVTGLPAGATATFSPPVVIPGTSAVNVALSVQTTATMVRAAPAWRGSGMVAMGALMLPWLMVGRRRWRRRLGAAVGGMLLLAAAGCGARSVSSGSLATQSYNFTVTATSTNLVGAVVVHSVPATLVVE